ncbi:MAG: tetratricopeptide repeat protein [Nitrospira sp. CG24D]|nr:MAG: tetratricopeptide repeat protein [Nitrospira sp. CG24D]
MLRPGQIIRIGCLALLALLVTSGVDGFVLSVQANSAPPSPRRLLEQGRSLEQQKQFPEAIAVYRQYLAARPENDEVRTTLAKLLSWQRQWDEASALYRDVLSRHPLDDESRVALGRVLSWQQRYDEATQEYDRVLRDHPQHHDALTGLADVLLWSGHPDQAIPYYQRVVEATGDPELAARLHSLKAESLPKIDPPVQRQTPVPTPVREAESVSADARQILESGHQLELARRYDEAVALYRGGLRRYPENDEVRSALARVLSWQGAHSEATSLYREVLARHPKDQDIRVALAQVLSWQKQFPESQTLYEQVVREEPHHKEARRGLAEVAHWQGNRTEALTRYEALVAETHDPEIEQQLRNVQSELLVSPRAAVGQGLTGLCLPYRDYAKLGYGHYSYTKGIPDERDLLFEVAKPIGDQTLVVRAEPINRFGAHDTPLSAELYSPLWKRAWGYVGAQGTVNPQFAPNYSFVGEMAQGLGGVHAALAPFEVSFGYRRLNYKQDDIDLLMPGLTVFLPFNLWLTEKVYLIPTTGAFTLSSQLTWRPTERVQVFASGSFGTSGERIVAAQDFTRVQSRTLQGGVTFPVNDRFSVEASGYYEDRGVLYIRRGGNLSLLYHW